MCSASRQGTQQAARTIGSAMAARGSNFTAEEECQTCISYLHVCKDPIVGTNQQSGTFWERTTEHFNSSTPIGSEIRTERSLETKWRQIRADVSKFVGIMATVRALPKSGESAEDDLERAEKLYAATKEKEMAGAAKNGKGKKAKKAGSTTFKLHHCWRILEKEPKWMTFRENNNSKDANASSTTRVSGQQGSTSSSSMNQRPQGNKGAKDEAKANAADRDNRKRVAAAATSMAVSSRKRTKALVEANRIALFSIPLFQLDPDAQEFFRLSREAALREMQSQAQDDPRRTPRDAHTQPGNVDDEEEKSASQQTYSVSDVTQRTELSQEEEVV
jgi:hypothetical protein